MKLYWEMSLELLLQLATKAFVEGTKGNYGGVTGTSTTVVFENTSAPLSLCSIDAFGLYDPDLRTIYFLSEYGKKWIIVDKGDDDPAGVINAIYRKCGVDMAEEAAGIAFEYGEFRSLEEALDELPF